MVFFNVFSFFVIFASQHQRTVCQMVERNNENLDLFAEVKVKEFNHPTAHSRAQDQLQTFNIHYRG